MFAHARSNRSRVLHFLATIFLTCDIANARPEPPNQVVVEFSVDVYDRDCKRFEVDQLRETLEEEGSPLALASYSTLSSLAKKKYCQHLKSGKLIFTVAEGQSASAQCVFDDTTLHVVAELMSLSKDSCEMSVQCAAAGSAVSLQGTGSTFSRSGTRMLPLDGTPYTLGGGGSRAIGNDGPGASSHRVKTIRVWRREDDSAPQTQEIGSGFGKQVREHNMKLLQERMSTTSPRFLRLDPVYDRLVLVHPAEYLEYQDVENISLRLTARAESALKTIEEAIEIDDEQRGKIELTFRRRNSKWQKELERFYLQSLSSPLEAGGKESRDQLRQLNQMLSQDFSVTDSFVWRIMKTQLSDELESQLSAHFIRQFVKRLSGVFDISDEARNRLIGLLDKRNEDNGGFVVDEQEYLDWLAGYEEQELADLFGNSRIAKTFRRNAQMANNSKVFFWNAAFSR